MAVGIALKKLIAELAHAMATAGSVILQKIGIFLGGAPAPGNQELNEQMRRLILTINQEISAINRVMLYVPKGFAQGFQTLADETEIDYEITPAHVPQAARGIRFDDADALGVAGIGGGECAYPLPQLLIVADVRPDLLVALAERGGERLQLALQSLDALLACR